MNSGLIFFLAALAILGGLLAWSFRDEGKGAIKDYFKTRTGLGVLKGIVIALGVVLLLVWCSPSYSQDGRWFGETTVFLGIEDAGNRNVVCVDGTRNDTIVSNLGLKQSIYESGDNRFNLGAKYSHHSCVLGEDDVTYDALGLELEYKLRK